MATGRQVSSPENPTSVTEVPSINTTTPTKLSTSGKLFRFNESATRAFQYQSYECPQPYVQQVAQPVFFAPQYCSPVTSPFAASHCVATPVPPGTISLGSQCSFYAQQASVPAVAGPVAYYPISSADQLVPGSICLQSGPVQQVASAQHSPLGPQMGYVASPPFIMVSQPQPKYIVPPAEAVAHDSSRLPPNMAGNHHGLCVAQSRPHNLTPLPPNAFVSPQTRTFAYKGGTTSNFRGTSRDFHGNSAQRPSGKQYGKYKTRPCINFSTTGACAYGTRCQYIHDEKLFSRQESEVAGEAADGDSMKGVYPGNELCGVDLSQRLCSSTPISRKTLKQAEMENAHGEKKKTYRQDFSRGAGCRKPNVIDGEHLGEPVPRSNLPSCTKSL